jgi:hypothetical protein
MKTKIIKLWHKTIVPRRSYQLKLEEKKLEKELGEALRKAKAAGNKEDIAEAKI